MHRGSTWLFVHLLFTTNNNLLLINPAECPITLMQILFEKRMISIDTNVNPRVFSLAATLFGGREGGRPEGDREEGMEGRMEGVREGERDGGSEGGRKEGKRDGEA